MGIAVLLSAIIDQVLPRISAPLIQIGLGLVIAALALTPIRLNLNPEFFLILFVGPILFNDARESDKMGLWSNRGKILSLAIGLVVAIMLVVGFTLHAIVPSIPLAAALALGAALGPTDAVAVTSLKGTVDLDPKESSLLSGEALINDASGVVAFQFAVAAAVTGAFSVVGASLSFVLGFFGGIAVGLALAAFLQWAQGKVHDMGLDNTTFHVLFDVMMPFTIFLVAEAVHTSGVLAVVAAGLFVSRKGQKVIGPNRAKLGIVSGSVWNVLIFVLNGIVFVMLGMQLPTVLSEWNDTGSSNLVLIVTVLIITVLIVLTRFLWIIIMERISLRRAKRKRTSSSRRRAQAMQSTPRTRIRSALISTIGGPKGAVTLSIILSLPLFTSAGDSFPHRDMIIFLASGVILCTLLLSNFLMPVLAPSHRGEEDRPETDEEVAEAKIAILRHVIGELQNAQDAGNRRATREVIRAYSMRIQRIHSEVDIDSLPATLLRLRVLERQRDELIRLREHGYPDNVEIARNMMRIARAQSLLQHKNAHGWVISNAVRHLPTFIRVFALNGEDAFRRATGRVPKPRDRTVSIILERRAIAYLEKLLSRNDSSAPAAAIAEQLAAHRATLQVLESANPSATMTMHRIDAKVLEVERNAYHLELEEIDNLFEAGKISRVTARNLRDNVYLMLVDLQEEM
jgi:Na+/H+ antiporter